MHRLMLAAALALAVSPAAANTITVTPTPTVTGDGPYTWAYAVGLFGDSTINLGDFFTILDFDGLVAGSQSVEPGWAASSSALGTCPATPLYTVLCAGFDDPTVPNLTWTRTGAPILGPGADQRVLLGTFTAQSIYNHPINDGWVSQDQDNQTGTPQEPAAGGTNVPQVPEPASLLLLGSGLAASAWRRRRAA